MSNGHLAAAQEEIAKIGCKQRLAEPEHHATPISSHAGRSREKLAERSAAPPPALKDKAAALTAKAEEQLLRISLLFHACELVRAANSMLSASANSFLSRKFNFRRKRN